MAVKVKVVKRDEANDRRITRTKSDRERLLDRKANLMREVKQIERALHGT